MADDRQVFETRIQRFSKVRRGRLNAALAYSLGSAASLGGVLVLLLLGGRLPGAFLNLGLFLVFLISLLALPAIYALRRRAFRSHLDEAFRMETLAGNLNSRLVSALDFLRDPSPSVLKRYVIAQTEDDLGFPFEEELDCSVRDARRKRFFAALSLCIVLGLTPWFHFANVKDSLRDSWHTAMDALFPVEYRLSPKPGRYIHQLGDKVSVSIQFLSRPYGEVTLVQKGEEDEKHEPFTIDEAGEVMATVTSDEETERELYFEFGNRKTESIRLVFTTKPVLENMETELVYPSYTRILPRTVEGIQEKLLGLPGTKMTLGFSFSKELVRASFTWDNDEELPLEVVGRFAMTSLIHHRNREATLQVKDIHGFSLEAPLVIQFELLRDERPRITIARHLKKNMPMKKEQAQSFSFGARLMDDYGVTRCLLKWQSVTVDDPTAVKAKGETERLISPIRKKAVVSFEKAFHHLDCQPGDMVVFHIEAFDNRTPEKQRSVSRKSSFFVYREGLEGFSVRELGFGSGMRAVGRLAKTRRSTTVKVPMGRRIFKKDANPHDGKMETSVTAPTIRGKDRQAIRDFFRLVSRETLSIEDER